MEMEFQEFLGISGAKTEFQEFQYRKRNSKNF
jgi:hypothetical protein